MFSSYIEDLGMGLGYYLVGNFMAPRVQKFEDYQEACFGMMMITMMTRQMMDVINENFHVVNATH